MTLQLNTTFVNQRRAGVLLHISSLPSAYYTGDLGVEAYRFIDFLSNVGASVWQTLPINMPHADNSPYQCLSAYAGNPDFISLETLHSDGLLSKEDLSGLISNKVELLAKAYVTFVARAESKTQANDVAHESFAQFCKAQAHWLKDFALFLALHAKFNHAGWNQWPADYRDRDVKTLEAAQVELAHEIAAIKFTQYVFFTQWLALKKYATDKKIKLFGDIPIFVAYDSAEVWSQPQKFKLDANKNMTVVAGVPPDYFCATGQRWGNPHYNWDVMAADGFAWWVSRMAAQSTLFDIVRIDHFRGLEASWEIPATEETAINGQWILAPGDALIASIKQALPRIELVAEDLGIITPEVDALRDKYRLPGMKILQFAFGDNDDNPYLPHHIEENSVAYTGTHDNDTTLGWYDSLDEQQREHVWAYLRAARAEDYMPDMPNDLVAMALETNAKLAIIPMQDILGLDGTHRMNTPGTSTGNWHWRFNWQQLTDEQQEFFANTIRRTQRG